MSERLHGLKQRLGQLSDLGHAVSLAHWDQQTMMPPQGGEARAESLYADMGSSAECSGGSVANTLAGIASMSSSL